MVYCNDCKWYYSYFCDPCIFEEKCNHPNNKYKKQMQCHFRLNKRGELLSPREKNSNNNCSDYQRKWWKVWV